MDVYKVVSRISKFARYGVFLALVMLFLNISIVSADGDIANALLSLCITVRSFLGIAMVLMIILAAVIYAVGQVMGAETRARATVWATAMLTGAVIGAVIYIITPPVVQNISGIDATVTGTGC